MDDSQNRDDAEHLPLPPALVHQSDDEPVEVRRVWDKQEQQWYYSVIDFVRLLTQSKNANSYWSMLKKRSRDDQGFQEMLKNIKEIPLRGKDGKLRGAECVTREVMLRLVQSIPSERAEAVRLWLAQVGEEKLQEMEQQTQVEQLRTYYLNKGRTPEWTEMRIQNLLSRNALTDEWLARGAQQNLHFRLLTGTIHRGTFDISPSDHHYGVKQLPKSTKHPRDHYTEDELGVLTLAELASRRIHEQNDSQGIDQLLKDAQAAGEFGGQVRRQFEELTKQRVVSPQNFLDQPKGKRKKKPDQLPPDQPTLFSDEETEE